MITTKQKPILKSQKIKRKEYKHTTEESHQITKKESKRRKKKWRGTTKIARKQQNVNKHIPVNNYFKCKWTKFYNQSTYEWILKKPSMCCLQGTHFRCKDTHRLK